MFGSERMTIKSDFEHCIGYLTSREIKMAISTRNCREGKVMHPNSSYMINALYSLL